MKDRLASYIYFKARECLDQAVLVANEEKVDKAFIKEWCHKEGSDAKRAYVDFTQKLDY